MQDGRRQSKGDVMGLVLIVLGVAAALWVLMPTPHDGHVRLLLLFRTDGKRQTNSGTGRKKR